MEESLSTAKVFVASLDQRKTQRISCSRPITLQTSDGREVLATCTDINSTGLGLDTGNVLRVGQRLELLLDTQDRVPLLVIYRMGNHYGLSALGSGEWLMELLPLQ